MLHRIFTLPQPVIAAVTGHAIAAGAFMLLAADVRVGVDGQYKIGANESAIGMTLPRFASELIEYRVPRHQIDHVAIGAHLYGPNEAMLRASLMRWCLLSNWLSGQRQLRSSSQISGGVTQVTSTFSS